MALSGLRGGDSVSFLAPFLPVSENTHPRPKTNEHNKGEDSKGEDSEEILGGPGPSGSGSVIDLGPSPMAKVGCCWYVGSANILESSGIEELYRAATAHSSLLDPAELLAREDARKKFRMNLRVSWGGCGLPVRSLVLSLVDAHGNASQRDTFPFPTIISGIPCEKNHKQNS